MTRPYPRPTKGIDRPHCPECHKGESNRWHVPPVPDEKNACCCWARDRGGVLG